MTYAVNTVSTHNPLRSIKTPRPKNRVKLTSIDLPHLRQRQPQLVPIQHRLALLHGVALEIHLLELLLVAQRALDLAEILHLAVARPDVLELRERLEPFERPDRVGLEVEDLELRVLREGREGRDLIVGDVEFC